MKVEKQIHSLWQAWEKLPKNLKDNLHMKKAIVGKWHYTYIQGDIRISLIKLNHITEWGGKKGRWQDYSWEICGGGLTDDCERFPSKRDAVLRILELFKQGRRGRHKT